LRVRNTERHDVMMNNKINVTINGQTVAVEKRTTLAELASEFAHGCKYPILAALVDNELFELRKPLISDCTVRFVDASDKEAYRTYQRSAVFLMLYAAKSVLGKNTRITIQHSINKNFYCEIQGQTVPQSKLDEIEQKMREAAAADLPIEKKSLTVEEAAAIAAGFGLEDKLLNFRYKRTANVNFYKLDWFYDYFYGAMAPSTGCITKFGLKAVDAGFLLLFPKRTNPDELSEVKRPEALTQVLHESKKWAKIHGIDTVGALNEKLTNGQRGNVIRITEALQEKRIANIADEINERGARLVLIAGPSSSGKTTFAERLSVQLRVNGLVPHVLSMDHYYLSRSQIPPDEFGEPDFEALSAIDVPQFTHDLDLLLKGETVEIPNFNFLTGSREYKGHFITLSENDVLVVEGIHGLNGAISDHIPPQEKYKIFISALTQLNLDDHNRIPTSDTRLMRRIVRDARTRGADAKRTFEMWPSVARGEERNIFPFQELADAVFNSALVYEMCVLKTYAEPLLFKINKSDPVYVEAKRLLKFLDCFIGIPDFEVPNNSLLREFIGGSVF